MTNIKEDGQFLASPDEREKHVRKCHKQRIYCGEREQVVVAD
jgi:hypothetical protein